MNSDKHGFRKLLLRHEAILFFALMLEWFYFNSAGPRFGSLDNTFDIIRHSVEIGLLALVMTPIILTGGIDLSGRLAVGAMRDSVWQTVA
jgi:rhamnose transport system permease protein